ncbi:hypothetical protein ACJMK2_030989 [Sinanodonta woodiana]|uniref:Mitochondria-eating protein C-terminal domain-containing protein n=1 Tax=Sinanodonta woodiana TaxID=1069815 RepID=A0ABD3WZI1_SINWO
MSIQDPPVVFSRDPERGDRFDTNLYQHYVHSGHTIDYVIWPALLLHTDGPLLTKGVAEPCTIPESKSGAPATEKNDASFEKRSKIEYDEKVRESSAGYDRRDTTQYGNNALFSLTSVFSPKVTQKYTVLESQ